MHRENQCHNQLDYNLLRQCQVKTIQAYATLLYDKTAKRYINGAPCAGIFKSGSVRRLFQSGFELFDPLF